MPWPFQHAEFDASRMMMLLAYQVRIPKLSSNRCCTARKGTLKAVFSPSHSTAFGARRHSPSEKGPANESKNTVKSID